MTVETPSEVLAAEHEAIETLLEALATMASRLRKGEVVPKDDLYDAMTVVVEFADGCHTAKEESVLFPALSDASPDVGAEIARRLTSDHRAFRHVVAAVWELIPRSTTKAVRRQIGKHLSTYTRLLREHIRVETEELLPEVERSLAPAQRERVTQGFERVEREEIGPGMHLAYRSIIRRLAEAYAALSSEPRPG